MSIAEVWTPSRRLRAAAAAERERIRRELARVAARERELEAELRAVQRGRAELEHQLNVLDHFSATPGVSPARGRPRLRAVMTVEPALGDTLLRGARIREVAVRILADTAAPNAPVHYRDWFELVTSRGFLPTGKDPLATFLTQIGRSPLVQRSTSSGTYVLDMELPARARGRLARLRVQLAEQQELGPGASVEQIVAARERRDQLTAEMHDIERQLEEVQRSLGQAEQ